MISTTPPTRDRDWALFLDVDGTLLEIAESPDAVRVPQQLREALSVAAARECGALALVSGRSLDELDRLFGPARYPAAGKHGLERRDAHGHLWQSPIEPAVFDPARAVFGELVRSHPGLLLEDKSIALALHYRRAPELEATVRAAAETLLAPLGSSFHLQAGKQVLEIKPRGHSKRTAIETFMTEAPFAGRLPVFVGDDITDEDGFAAVNGLGGLSIRVGEGSTAAQFRLADVSAVLSWLADEIQERR